MIGGFIMYHYIEDKGFLSKMRSKCSDIVNQLVQTINKENKLQVRAYPVGSGAKNLITQNNSNAIDLDYNIEILEFKAFDMNDCEQIKKYIGKKFDEVLLKNNWSNCQYSSSVFTTKQRTLSKGNKTPFSIDLCIVKHRNNCWDRLICENTGYISLNRYYWNEAPHSTELSEKADKIKKSNHWPELRQIYLDKKNMYLQRNDHYHPSFIVYIEAINEAYDKYCR